MYYTRLEVACDADFSEILIAEIAQAGFDTFMETDTGFEAYAEEDHYDKNLLTQVNNKYNSVSPFSFSFSTIEKKNWNEEWENNLQPIIVDDLCLVRAEFHKIEEKYPYEIVITPKMSFGTGHHQTTYLMLKSEMKMDFKNKRVMDAGCGTAILSIMASKRGAREVLAFDIDEWSVINGKENIGNNGSQHIDIRQGKLSEMKFEGKFDVILANINKNVLLDEMQQYADCMTSGAELLLSGFYTHDIDDLKNEAAKFSLAETQRDERETWASLRLVKNT